MNEQEKTHCDMKRTLRHAGASYRDQYQCYAAAEFFVNLRGGTKDQTKFTCAQHLSKATREVLAMAESRDAARAIVSLLADLDVS